MKNLYIPAVFMFGALSLNAQINLKDQKFQRMEKISVLTEQISKPVQDAKAQGIVVWDNEFDVPADWTIGAANVQGQWQIVSTTPANVTQYAGAMASSTFANGFGLFNGVQYLLGGVVEAQDATLTTVTPIDLSTYPNVNISFQQRYRAYNTDETWVEFSTDGGTVWTGIQYNTQYLVNDPAVQNTITTNVSSLIGGQANVLVRFRWKSPSGDDLYGSGYAWMVDDVKIITSSDDQVALNGVFIGDIVNDFSYSIVPTAQTAPMVIGVSLQNDGINNFSDDINVSIKLNGTEVDNFDYPYALASGAADTVWITSTYTASTIGDYTVDVTIPVDDEPTDNAGTSTVSTSNYVYAHDFGGTTQRGFDQDDETAMGNLYLMQADQDISSVNVKFRTGTTVGQEVIIGVYEIGANIQDQSYVAEAFYTIAPTDIAASFVTIELDDAVTLNAGSVYCVSIKKQAGTSRLYVTGTAGDNDFGTACYGPFGTGDAVNWYNGWGWSPYVRANFDPSLAIKETSILQDVNVYPNPSANNTTVKFNLANSSNVEIKVLDITGKTVETINIDNAAAGANDANLNVANYATGVYNVVISSNESSVTKKFVKK